MNEKEQIYKSLQEKYSQGELADAILLSDSSVSENAIKAKEEFVKLRMARKNNLTEKEQLYSNILTLKYNMKSYLSKHQFNSKNTFGDYLRTYLKVVGRTQKRLAEEINIHPSRLSRIIKGKEPVGKSLAYRLEEHSGTLIPAIFWWKIFQLEVEQEIMTAKEERIIEKKHVTKIAYRA